MREIGAALCEGHITAATYFGSLQGASNRRFTDNFRRTFGPDRPVSMWSAGAYAQVHLFALALAEAAHWTRSGSSRLRSGLSSMRRKARSRSTPTTIISGLRRVSGRCSGVTASSMWSGERRRR